MIVVNMFGNVTQIETRDICPPLRSQTGGCIPMIIQKVYDPSRRHDYEEWEDVCGTLENRMGTGGGNVPIVVEQFVLELDTTIKIGGGAASRLEEQDKCR